MVGESDTVSRSFSTARNSLIWIGGFLAVFTTIFVVATAFDSISGKQVERTRSRLPNRNLGRPQPAEEPSMGLSPETVNQPTSN